MSSPPIYTIQLPVYEGPLDLLLNLIEHAELDITKVLHPSWSWPRV